MQSDIAPALDALWWNGMGAMVQIEHPILLWEIPTEASMRTGAIVLALLFAVVAVVYFVLPAGSLPSFFPGFEPGSARIHVKHGVAALAVAIVLFGIGWFAGRSGR
jgi:hypothetical protein